MRIRILKIWVPAVTMLLAIGSPVFAQYGGNQMGMGGMSGGSMSSLPLSSGLGQSSNYGMFGSRTLGGGVNPQQGSFANGGAGALAGGGAPGGLGLQNQQMAGQITGNERFLRQNQRPGQFVGNDSTDSRNFIGAMSQLVGNRNMGFGGQGFGQGQNANRQGNRQNQNRGGRGQGNRSPLQTTYVAGFDVTSPSTSNTASRLAKQLTASRHINAVEPIQVELQGQTAILRGVVANTHQRDLAAQMALLEPGVVSIQNDLQIAPPRSALEPELPAPTNSRSTR